MDARDYDYDLTKEGFYTQEYGLVEPQIPQFWIDRCLALEARLAALETAIRLHRASRIYPDSSKKLHEADTELYKILP